MNPEYIQLGALAAIFALGIREFFSWLKSRNAGADDVFDKKDYTLQILGQMEKIANNDLVHILAAIEDGNKRLVDIIHEDNMKIIEVLGEIKGKIK